MTDSSDQLLLLKRRAHFMRQIEALRAQHLTPQFELTLADTQETYEQVGTRLAAAHNVKSYLHVSLAYEHHLHPPKTNNTNTNTEVDTCTHFDASANKWLTIYGIFVCVKTASPVPHVAARVDVFFLVARASLASFDACVRQVLERTTDDGLAKVVFNAKLAYKLLSERLGVRMSAPVLDPIVADWLLHQDAACGSVQQLLRKYCATTSASASALATAANRLCAVQRALHEALLGIELFGKLKLQLQLHNMWPYYVRIESAISLLCAKIELSGFRLDTVELVRIKDELLARKRELEEAVNQCAGGVGIAGRPINLSSSEQVAHVLYERLKLKPVDTTLIGGGRKLRHHSTCKQALQQMASQHKIVRYVIMWRKIQHTLANCIYPIEQVST